LRPIGDGCARGFPNPRETGRWPPLPSPGLAALADKTAGCAADRGPAPKCLVPPCLAPPCFAPPCLAPPCLCLVPRRCLAPRRRCGYGAQRRDRLILIRLGRERRWLDRLDLPGELEPALDVMTARTLQRVMLIAGHRHGVVRHHLDHAHFFAARETSHLQASRQQTPRTHSRSWSPCAARPSSEYAWNIQAVWRN